MKRVQSNDAKVGNLCHLSALKFLWLPQKLLDQADDGFQWSFLWLEWFLKAPATLQQKQQTPSCKDVSDGIMASHEQSQAEAVVFVSSLPTLRFVEKESFQDFLPTVTSAQLSEGEAAVENDPSLFRKRWC